ncbi:hypothetical protein [Vitiosangium sp. GDMCC 1.1324]|uniref:hypothetical protein n=1 Tax=Vitiosangium sp. (strain GDMCC 1.1324) TaxID=2138576 RepID=UPI000D34B3CE|nr:hypothetical protein [Vitiosangium sp. GDMCC 1.1324]PTL75552.1 hypothetical protein DAT35_54025 [Vitiosangium sp. GDMCC 1.1324]
MVPLRSAIAFVFSAALFGAGCATETPERRMVPEPAYDVQNELGYNDVVRLSQDYATAHGYEVTEVAEAVQVRPNYWRVRFGLAPRGSGKLLDLEFDQAQRRVVGTTEVGSSAGRGTPAP